LITLDLPQIRETLVYRDIIDRMRDALIANSRGECDTPMPMHLDIAPAGGEVHMKSSYRRGGKYFALKVASTFPRQTPSGNGMMLLSSAETGEPVAFLADSGHLTDVRTAAAAAMVARELGRDDDSLGILGTGVQARLQALMHAQVLDLREVWVWGRNPDRAVACARDIAAMLPGVRTGAMITSDDIAKSARLIVTCTAAREPLLQRVPERAHISAVGSDAPGKQELDPTILHEANLLLVDSLRQCEKLGELQHAPEERGRAIEIGAFCEKPVAWQRHGLSVCDFTGLGVEDLYIAEYCYENRKI
jgi:ornithine cyclodeaminase